MDRVALAVKTDPDSIVIQLNFGYQLTVSSGPSDNMEVNIPTVETPDGARTSFTIDGAYGTFQTGKLIVVLNGVEMEKGVYYTEKVGGNGFDIVTGTGQYIPEATDDIHMHFKSA